MVELIEFLKRLAEQVPDYETNDRIILFLEDDMRSMAVRGIRHGWLTLKPVGTNLFHKWRPRETSQSMFTVTYFEEGEVLTSPRRILRSSGVVRVYSGSRIKSINRRNFRND